MNGNGRRGLAISVLGSGIVNCSLICLFAVGLAAKGRSVFYPQLLSQRFGRLHDGLAGSEIGR